MTDAKGNDAAAWWSALEQELRRRTGEDAVLAAVVLRGDGALRLDGRRVAGGKVSAHLPRAAVDLLRFDWRPVATCPVDHLTDAQPQPGADP